MPGEKHKRKIVSKRQQRFLFAAANRGEIPKKKVEHMAHETQKTKGSLANLPETHKEASAMIAATVDKVAGICKNASVSSNLMIIETLDKVAAACGMNLKKKSKVKKKSEDEDPMAGLPRPGYGGSSLGR